MDTLEIIKLIRTTIKRAGKGTDENPVRIITQYWDFDGNLLFEYDPYLDKFIHYKKCP